MLKKDTSHSEIVETVSSVKVDCVRILLHYFALISTYPVCAIWHCC